MRRGPPKPYGNRTLSQTAGGQDAWQSQGDMTDLNTTQYAEFKAKRALWIECLSGDDRHSVIWQIHDMLWNAATFHVIGEARRLANPAKEGGVELSGLVHRLIDECFSASQAAAIRRLTDKSPLSGGQGVYSLTSLLTEMGKNARLMTRAHMFAAEGLELDYRPVQQACLEYERQHMRLGDVMWLPSDLDWLRIVQRHRVIDRLTGVTEQTRSNDDWIRPVVFAKLRQKVEGVCADVIRHVNKSIAHAATPESRETVSADKANITWGHLWRAHEAICKVANFVNLYMLTGTQHSLLAIPQYDHFAYIDRPLVKADKVQYLRTAWDRYGKETEAWTNWGIDEFESECKNGW